MSEVEFVSIHCTIPVSDTYFHDSQFKSRLRGCRSSANGSANKKGDTSFIIVTRPNYDMVVFLLILS